MKADEPPASGPTPIASAGLAGSGHPNGPRGPLGTPSPAGSQSRWGGVPWRDPSRAREPGALALGLAAGLALYQWAPSAPLALGGAALFGLLALCDPARALAFVPLTLPLVPQPRDLGGLAFPAPELALGLTAAAVGVRAAAGWLAARAGSSRPRGAPRLPPPGPFDAPAALLLAAALLSLLVSEYLRLSLRELRLLFVEPVLFFYLARLLAPDLAGALRLSGAFLLGAVGVALLGVAQFLLGVNLTEVEGVRRIQATYTSPNHLGLLLGRALPYALALALAAGAASGHRRLRPLARAATLALAVALLLTFSIGAWIGAVAATLVVVALLGGRRALLPTVGALALLLAGAALLLPPERLLARLDLSQGTGLLRLYLWQSALAMVRDHPVLGIGLDNFLYLYQQVYLLEPAASDPNLSHPHNWLLHFWLALGLPGLSAFLWLLGRFVRTVARAWPAAGPAGRALLAGASGALADTLVHGTVDNSYFLPDLALLFWLGLAVALAAAPAGAAERPRPAAPA